MSPNNKKAKVNPILRRKSSFERKNLQLSVFLIMLVVIGKIL